LHSCNVKTQICRTRPQCVNIIPRHTIMSLDISFQIFNRLSARSDAMPYVGSRFLTSRLIAQATVSCFLSLSAVRIVALIARCFNSLIRTLYAGHLSCRLSFDFIVSFILFFFYTHSTLSYLYFILICYFLALFSLLCHSSCLFLDFPLYFIFCFLPFMSCFPSSVSFN
jgi:hypothetical protein